jgi:hypothetical protein
VHGSEGEDREPELVDDEDVGFGDFAAGELEVVGPLVRQLDVLLADLAIPELVHCHLLQLGFCEPGDLHRRCV